MNKNWEYYKLSDVCSIHGRIGWQGLTRKEHKTSGDYLLITGTDFTDDNKINLKTCVYVDEYRYTQDENIQIKKDDLLITKDGTLGKLALISEELPKPATLNGGIFVLRDKTKKLYPRFLLQYMKSDEFRKIIHNNRTGSTVPHLTQNMLINFPIPVPPLAEQERIVKILDQKFAQIDALKQNAEANLNNAKALFQSELELRLRSATSSENSVDESFPVGERSRTNWKTVRLGDCGTFKNGMNFASTESGYSIHSLGVGDFKNLYKIENTESLSEISLNGAPSEEYLLKDGDIVFVRSNGNKELVGRCLLVYPKNIPTTYSGFCIRFRKEFEQLDADFLLHFMKSDKSRKILNGKEGANISNLNQKILGDFEIPLPPLEEQKRIVAHLDFLSEKVHQLEEIYTKQLADCDELKQSFLQKAFEGEL